MNEVILKEKSHLPTPKSVYNGQNPYVIQNYLRITYGKNPYVICS